MKVFVITLFIGICTAFWAFVLNRVVGLEWIVTAASISWMLVMIVGFSRQT